MLFEVELFDYAVFVFEEPDVSFCSPLSEQAKRIKMNKVRIKFLFVIFFE